MRARPPWTQRRPNEQAQHGNVGRGGASRQTLTSSSQISVPATPLACVMSFSIATAFLPQPPCEIAHDGARQARQIDANVSATTSVRPAMRLRSRHQRLRQSATATCAPPGPPPPLPSPSPADRRLPPRVVVDVRKSARKASHFRRIRSRSKSRTSRSRAGTSSFSVATGPSTGRAPPRGRCRRCGPNAPRSRSGALDVLDALDVNFHVGRAGLPT